MSTLNEKLSAAAAAPPRSAALDDGALTHVSLELLDDNPYQPRTTMDAVALEELRASILAQGLIQPIAVRPTKDGRFIIVAGHRRVAAFRALQAAASAGDGRWDTIAAQVRLALDDAQLAAQAFIENVTREALTPLEEMAACEKILGAGLARNVEELAALLNQPVRRITRLRRLAQAPQVVKQAVGGGLRVVVGQGPDGAEITELRRLDFFGALAFQRLFEHLKKGRSEKVAAARTETALRRALAGLWGVQRTEAFVLAVIEGKAQLDDATEAEGDAPAALFTITKRRFIVETRRLATSTPEERAAMRDALEDLLRKASAGAADVG